MWGVVRAGYLHLPQPRLLAGGQVGGVGGETQPPAQPEGGLEGEVDEDEKGGAGYPEPLPQFWV